MVCVDLNPIRADTGHSLEDSDYTSIKLSSFIGSSLKKDGIAFDLKDYLELTDWTGRLVRVDKRGFIDAGTPGIQQKLQLDEHTWMETLQGYSKGFHSFVDPET